MIGFSFVAPTNSQLEVVSCVGVDVCQRLLHGQSKQDQLAEVVPAVFALLSRQGVSGWWR